MLAWFASRPAARAWALLTPGLVWLVLFFFAPLTLMLVYSVLGRGTYGGVEWHLTLEAYGRFLDPLYLRVLERTVVVALAATGLCLVLGYPVAWVIARSNRWRQLLLVLVVLPFWTSFLVRTYAIAFLLRDEGVINTLLRDVGLISAPIEMLYTRSAVMAGLVYGYLPFMILPIYASLEKLDQSLLEAAESLGARGWARFVHVVLPLSLPGVIAGCLLVFIPALGAFLTPDLLGGARQLMIGNLVQNQFTSARNWPFGAAASFVLVGVALVVVVGWLIVRDRREAA
jgi:spermidine/putrescine transport system permease protein